MEISTNIIIVLVISIASASMIVALTLIISAVIEGISGHDPIKEFMYKRRRKREIKDFKRDRFKVGDKVKINQDAISRWRIRIIYTNFLYLNRNKILKINKIYYDKKEKIGMMNISRINGSYKCKLDIYNAQRILVEHNPTEIFDFDENLFKM